MAVTAQKSVAALMRKTLDRQAAVTRMKVCFKSKQIERILVNFIKDGNSVSYNELLKILNDGQLSDSNFKVLFEDCLSCVIYMERELKSFIQVLCNIEWVTRDQEIVDVFGTFIVSLLTAHTYHCPRVMTELVKLFRVECDEWDDQPSKEQVARWSNIHSLIAHIVAVMPMSSNILMQTIVENFPYYKAGRVNRSYVYNLIWISKYITSLREQILTTIIIKMIEMDVNVVEGNKMLEQESIYKMEVDEKDKVSHILDCCMFEMLQWMQDEREHILYSLCNVFERVILPTYGIRHVQFLLLYAISINQQCADRIFKNLWMIAAGLHGIGPGALTTRRTAASHLAGLLARCVRVTRTRLVHYLKTMADWCHGYITATQETSANDSTKVHGAFHAICHAIFYLVAFKNHHLFRSKSSLNFVESLNLPRLVSCPLNPLRTCPPQVTRAFSSVTRSHQVVYCQAIIEKNTRLSLTNTVEYDEWFPYDPYTLPLSGKTIWPLCVEYKDWLKEGDDETQYTSLKRKLDAEDDDYLITYSSQKLHNSLSNCSMPGFKTSETILS
ncbi:RNA polymerase I-specific transcription initiation factor RRN3 [Leptidea sinapis]|uniref:RNA polymerase I-specific transcription initiation factor RRN3 n=1 Tax=Leptidea sinapis TaxID=189913 RepID=UPI00212C82AC|nr:RNA polymerase I-specific transcription initiation factor RRN3 [Leptidea sinapis]